MGVGHYENFPVASLLAPPALRTRFGRSTASPAPPTTLPMKAMRHPRNACRAWRSCASALDAIDTRCAGDWPDLARAVRTHALPTPLLRDLLSAFRTGRRHAALRQLRVTARLLPSVRESDRALAARALRDAATRSCAAWSDAICTALQLTNFWQDVAPRLGQGAHLLPQPTICERFAVGEADLASACRRSAGAR